MARNSLLNIRNEIISLINDNTTGDITPADLRSVLLDLIDTLAPAYGQFSIPTSALKPMNLTTLDQIVTWDAFRIGSLAQYSNLGNTFQRIHNDQLGVSRVDFTMDIVGPNGRFVVATLYVDGVATQAAASATMAGLANPISFNFGIIVPTAAEADFDIRLRSEVDGAVEIGNAAFILSNVPVYDFGP